MEGKCLGERRALLNARSSCRCRRPRLLPRPSKAAMSASAVYVLDLKGKVLKGSPPSALPGNQRALALSGPTLLLGNWPTSPARASGRRGSLTCQPYPVARKWAVVFSRVPPHCSLLGGLQLLGNCPLCPFPSLCAWVPDSSFSCELL